jgi:hypothetical protein
VSASKGHIAYLTTGDPDRMQFFVREVSGDTVLVEQVQWVKNDLG